MNAIERPADTEYASFYAGYISLVPEADVLGVLEQQKSVLSAVAAAIPATKETHAYAPGKWSIRELFGHLGDGERVFGYRACCFSRADPAELPPFDENAYVANSRFATRPVSDLMTEFTALRTANLAMLRGLDDAAWRRVGTANRAQITVRALAFVMAGHVRHHLIVLRDQYGVATGT